MNFFDDSEDDWDSWDTLAAVLQRAPPPPSSHGSTPPPGVTVNGHILFTPQPLPPNHLRVIMDTSVISLILDGCVLSTHPAHFFWLFSRSETGCWGCGAIYASSLPKCQKI